MPRLHSGAATDRPVITHLTLPPIPEVVWQQLQETHVSRIQKTSTDEAHKKPTCPNLNREKMYNHKRRLGMKPHRSYPGPIRNRS